MHSTSDPKTDSPDASTRHYSTSLTLRLITAEEFGEPLPEKGLGVKITMSSTGDCCHLNVRLVT
jgi:hypothetical protein